MPSPAQLLELGNAAVVAPAGHGKTEIIAAASGLAKRSLILTHTHAGVHAIRARLKRLGVPSHKAAVDTIAGWCTRYSNSFPGAANPPKGLPQTPAQWEQLYRGARLALEVRAVREVIAASYDRIFIDEYQDCPASQHFLAMQLSRIVPTLIFGDPMQGIFEFAGATLSWPEEILTKFPLAGTLDTPHRWAGKNPDLGAWVAETREKLIRGEAIDLRDQRITFRQTDDAFDMGALFEGYEEVEGSLAAIHCNKTICYNLARASCGGYQAIEEIAANRLRGFANGWDHAEPPDGRREAIFSLIKECFNRKQSVAGEAIDPAVEAALQELRKVSPGLNDGNGAIAAAKLLMMCKRVPGWKLFRYELWRDAERAMGELATGRAPTLLDAVVRVRERASRTGRTLSRRIVATPLLLKGLEFDHVVIPDARHFLAEDLANAKLFYVAISRATRSLRICSSDPLIQFDRPRL